MLIRWMTGMIALGLLSTLPATPQEDRERRLHTVTITTLPPDKGELHINPIIRRPQDFQRPGFSELELTFVPVALIGDALGPMLGEENRDYLKLITKLPERAEGVAFQDTEKSYLTQSVILPRGHYVLSEVTYRQPAPSAGMPDLRTVSHCLASDSFILHVKGGDVMFMGRLEFEYPTLTRLEDPDFNPAQMVLDDLDALSGWRWTTKDLLNFNVSRTTFERSPEFCSPDSVTAGF
jgi:hypothetical protein